MGRKLFVRQLSEAATEALPAVVSLIGAPKLANFFAI